MPLLSRLPRRYRRRYRSPSRPARRSSRPDSQVSPRNRTERRPLRISPRKRTASPRNPIASPTQAYGQPPASGYPQQPGQPPAPGYGQPQPYYQPAQSGSGKATGALVCGILAIIFCGLPIVGIVLGIVAIVLASKAVKLSGKDGKTTASKVCGIIGIVFSIIWFIVGMVAGCTAFYEAIDSSVSSSSSGLIADSSSGSAGGSSDAAEEEAALESAASARLDTYKNVDAAVVERLAADIDQSFLDDNGFSLSDLGVEASMLAEWMVSDFDYELDGAYPFDDAGTVYADVTQRDGNELASQFSDNVQAAVDAGEIDTTDEAAAMASIGEILKSTMESTTDLTTYYVSIEFVKQNGEWVIDEDAWAEQEEYLFNLY